MDEKTPTDETTTTPPSDTAPAYTAPASTDEGDVPADASGNPSDGTVAIVGTASDKATFLAQLTQDQVYLMGLSFLVGVLFTVFILLVFDFMRRNSSDTTITK